MYYDVFPASRVCWVAVARPFTSCYAHQNSLASAILNTLTKADCGGTILWGLHRLFGWLLCDKPIAIHWEQDAFARAAGKLLITHGIIIRKLCEK